MQDGSSEREESTAVVREPLPGRKELAAYIGMTEAGVAQLHYRGLGPRQIKIGRTIRYEWDEIDRWIESQKVDATTDFSESA